MGKIHWGRGNSALFTSIGFFMLVYGITNYFSRVNLEIGLIDLDKILKDPGEEDTKINCSRPLAELCSTMGKAVACGVAPYCIHCIWATSFDPNDASYGKCKRCQIAIKDARYNEDLPNFDYSKNLRPICNHHILKEDADSCLSNIDHYLTNRQELWSMDPLKLNALETCSILGLCYSPFSIIVPQNSHLLVEDSLKNSGGKTRATFISDKSIRNVEEAKVAHFESNYTKNEQKFLPIFKPTSLKNVCKFMDVVDLNNSGGDTIPMLMGGILVLLSAITYFCSEKLERGEREENEVDEYEVDFCEELNEE